MNLGSYTELSRTLHQPDHRTPLEVTMEMTHRCPLECQHCYNNLAMGDLSARNRELSKEEYFRLLDEITEMGCFWLLFTGGEIFARKDFLEIYTYAKQKGLLITLFTNGNLINEKIADYLLEWPPFAIEITLYGRTKETYEALTQIPGSYERCMRGINLLRSRGLPLKLKTVATTVNKHEVLSMRSFVREELGLEFKFDSLMNPRIDCSQSPLAVRLLPEEVVALDLHSPETKAEYRRFAEQGIQSSPPSRGKGKNSLYVCGGGVGSFSIDPYGRMSICVLSKADTYDLRRGSVKEGWEQFLLQVRKREAKTISKCTDCRLRSLCGMCPANGELENGDAESPVEFLCEVAHLRAMALGYEVPAHGDCAFCEGGDHYEAAKESARRIASREIDVGEWTGPAAVLLPILNHSTASSGGCGSCGH
ncbi:MAG TPA: radical SAM protein [Terriglobales bacterium]|jgi:radical SAM protein with 4Fe4S-binding SPASM domain